MKKQNLKQHNIDFYQDQSLDEHKLEQLLSLAESVNTNNSDISSVSKRNYIRSIAAAIIIAVSIPLGIQQILNTDNSQLVPQEIALNHLKQLSLEFDANNYASLNKMMPKLDFKLESPENTQLAGLTILGGRYCSIQGNLAAQIRLTDKKGLIYTLYQTPLTEALKLEKTGTFPSQDIEISQWNESGLFFGLARSIIN